MEKPVFTTKGKTLTHTAGPSDGRVIGYHYLESTWPPAGCLQNSVPLYSLSLHPLGGVGASTA